MRIFQLLVSFALLADVASAQDAVGINAHVPSPDMVELAASAGVQWIRVDANWWQLEPGPDDYRWEILDGPVRDAIEHGLQVYMTLAYTPEWVPSVPTTRDMYSGNDEPLGSEEWVDFVQAAVTHYRALGVTHFGLWNEPNLEGFWEGSIDAYSDKIALPGAAAVRRVCSDCVTLGPDLAHVGDVDVALDRIMARASSAFDIIAHHLYGSWAELGHGVFDGDSFLNALEMRRFAFTRASMREILDRHGWTGEVWITETGYRMDPVDSASEAARQATYVRRVLEEQLARDWWTHTFFYELVDCGIDLPGCDIDGFGLTRPTRSHPRTAEDHIIKPALTMLGDFIRDHPEIGGGSTLACVNGLDDDGDGRIDLQDRGCSGEGDGDEVDGARTSLRASPLSPVIDGDLSDWADASWVDATDWVGDRSRDELTARASAAWASDTLYLAFEVTDDRHVNDHDASTLWAGDSVQIAFDIGRQFADDYDGDDLEIDVALAGGAAIAHRNHGSGDNAWRVAVVHREGVTRYEIALAGSVLGTSLRANQRVGMSWLVNEDDGAGRQGWLQWTPGIGADKAPYWFGEVVLVSASAVDAGGSELDAGATASDAGSAPDTGRAPDVETMGSDGGGCSVAGSVPASWLMLALLSMRRRRSLAIS